MCLKHGKMCMIPPATERLFVAGFDCKPFSCQNPKRFDRDAGTLEHETLNACMSHITQRSPDIVLLENTGGLKPDAHLLKIMYHPHPNPKTIELCCCLPRKASGGDNKEPLIEQVLARLRSAHDKTQATDAVEASAHPLSTGRSRVLFYAAETAMCGRLVSEHRKLHAFCAGLPKHSCVSCLTYQKVRPPPTGGPAGPAAKAKLESEYQKYFAKGLKTAIEKNRLPADVIVPSSRWSAGLNTPPWLTANVDIYGLIVREELANFENKTESEAPQLADVSQTSNRGRVCLSGLSPTVTTSSQWFDYSKGQMVHPESFFKIHGHRVSKLRTKGFTQSELHRFAGNGMATTTMAIALTPVLLELGYLEKIA